MTNTKTTRFYIDFDGVICDSAFECFYSSMSALDIIVDASKCFSSVRWQEFRALRPSVIGAEDYIFLQRYLDDPCIKTQTSFSDFLLNQGAKVRIEARDLMNATRIALIEEDRELWYGLNPLYKTIAPVLAKCVDHPDLFIFSNKKPEFIREILDFHKIAWPIQKILYSAGESKQKMILNDLLPADKMGILIDDQIENLMPVLNPDRLKTVLAAWGYVHPRWLTGAGVAVMTENDFVMEIQKVLG